MQKRNKYVRALISLMLLSKISVGQISVETNIDSTNHDSCYCITVTTSVLNNLQRQIDNIKTVKCYYYNGKLKEEFSKVKGDRVTGIYNSYYDNGQLREVFNSILGRRVGLYVEYYPTGVKKTIGYYEDIKSVSDIKKKCDTTVMVEPNSKRTTNIVACEVESVKIGEWLYYNEAGEIIRREHFK